MKVHRKSLDSVELVVVEGRVDSATWQELEKILGSILEDGRYKIVVDLAGVYLMVTAGLKILVKAQVECKNHEGEVKISCPSERMDFELRMAGYETVFSVYDDQAEAIDSFSIIEAQIE